MGIRHRGSAERGGGGRDGGGKPAGAVLDHVCGMIGAELVTLSLSSEVRPDLPGPPGGDSAADFG